MKDFFKYVLATIVGIVILGLIMAILSVLSLGSVPGLRGKHNRPTRDAAGHQQG